MYRWVDHTAELELHLAAPEPEGVLAEAVAALSELLGPSEGERVERSLAVNGRDRAALLAELLAELAFLAENEGLVPQRLVQAELGEQSLRAEVELRRGDPPHLVKGVTLHRLSFEEDDGGHNATVILDV